jgi:hypothetical protein
MTGAIRWMATTKLFYAECGHSSSECAKWLAFADVDFNQRFLVRMTIPLMQSE